MKIASILGLNARTHYSYLYNTKRGKRIGSSKLLTKRVLAQAGIAVPETYAKFTHPRDIVSFDWETLPSSFALKPSKGLGGEGIIVVKKKAKDGDGWITTQRERVRVEDLKLHALDILEGAYSVSNVPDVAFFEEYVGRHKAFRKYAYRGTPDMRVVVFNKVPVMSMLRLPTRASQGRANLHQGAIGVGVDIATGITTKAIWHGRQIRYKPRTKRKLHGIKIPGWIKVLQMAVRCQEETGLGYVGVDIVLHPEKGPMVLELNYQPGLQIQLANMAGLKKRLERVEGLEVKDAEHGVKIAKALFAGSFADRVRAEEGVKTVGIFEKVKILGSDKKRHLVEAKLDTGAWRTSIDKNLASELGLLQEGNILWRQPVRSALGTQKRPIINLTLWLKGRKIETVAGVADRKNLKKRIVIGRRDLAGFLVSLVKDE